MAKKRGTEADREELVEMVDQILTETFGDSRDLEPLGRQVVQFVIDDSDYPDYNDDDIRIALHNVLVHWGEKMEELES